MADAGRGRGGFGRGRGGDRRGRRGPRRGGRKDEEKEWYVLSLFQYSLTFQCIWQGSRDQARPSRQGR